MFFGVFWPWVKAGKPARAASILTWRDGSIRDTRKAPRSHNCKETGCQFSICWRTPNVVDAYKPQISNKKTQFFIKRPFVRDGKAARAADILGRQDASIRDIRIISKQYICLERGGELHLYYLLRSPTPPLDFESPYIIRYYSVIFHKTLGPLMYIVDNW